MAVVGMARVLAGGYARGGADRMRVEHLRRARAGLYRPTAAACGLTTTADASR